MQQASWDSETGRWCMLQPGVLSPLATSLELDGQLGPDIAASTAASLKASSALLAKPPWELQSASSISSWQVGCTFAPQRKRVWAAKCSLREVVDDNLIIGTRHCNAGSQCHSV